MSVRQDNSSKVAATAGSMSGLELENVAQGDAEFAEGSGHDIAQPENPLTRNVVVSIRASLNELCLQKQKGTWAPSQEALRSIFQQVRLSRRPATAPATCPSPNAQSNRYKSLTRRHLTRKSLKPLKPLKPSTPSTRKSLLALHVSQLVEIHTSRFRDLRCQDLRCMFRSTCFACVLYRAGC